jgi:hypothetical protein
MVKMKILDTESLFIKIILYIPACSRLKIIAVQYQPISGCESDNGGIQIIYDQYRVFIQGIRQCVDN